MKITEKELNEKLEKFNHGKGYSFMTKEQKEVIKIWFINEFNVEVIK